MRTFDNPDRYAFNDDHSVDHAMSILHCVERAIGQTEMLKEYVDDHLSDAPSTVKLTAEAVFFSLVAELRDVKLLAEIAYEADLKRKRRTDA